MTPAEKDLDFDCIRTYYIDYYDILLRTAMVVLENHSLAEVAVQEAFITAIVSIDKLKASPNPKGWLLKVVHNKCKHVLRDIRILAVRCVAFDSIHADPPDKRARMDELRIALKNEPDYQFLERLYIHGESIREIAESEGIEIGACKMRIARAKQRLRKKYSDE